MTEPTTTIDPAARPRGAAPDNHQHTYSPVRVNDTVGAVFLGLFSLILLVVLLVTQSRNRKLEAQLARLQPPV